MLKLTNKLMNNQGAKEKKQKKILKNFVANEKENTE